jgi:uncharacterized protein (TIGR00730 family)
MKEIHSEQNQPRGLRVTVFGGSKTKPGEPEYQDAYGLGVLLGKAGYTVLTGGYIGTMEAVSRGVAESGGHVIGVTCDEIETWRPVAPNPWVMQENRFSTLHMRLNSLIQDCDAAIALPGGIGTLAEIAVMWSQLQTGASLPKPLILVGLGWEATMQAFYLALGTYVSENDRDWLRFVPDVETASRELQAALPVDQVS